MRKRKKWTALFAAMTAFSVLAADTSTANIIFAKEAEGQAALSGEQDYIFEGNMLENPSFQEGLEPWNGSAYGLAQNNPCPNGGDTHYYLDPGGWIGQKLKVPYTGYYKVSTWAAVGGDGAYFGANNDTTGQRHGIDIDSGSEYALYEQEVWMNQGEQIDVFVLAKTANWVNGDMFSLEYNTYRFPNLAVNPEFEDDTVWTKTGNASVGDGCAVLTGKEDSVSQSIYIPRDGFYYAEVVLEDGDNAEVSFAGSTRSVSGDKTVKLTPEAFTGHDAREIKVSGKAVVKSVEVKFDLSKVPNTVPSASDVMISGVPTADLSLEGTYQFSDPDGDEEGATQYQWLISDSADGDYTEIEGANRKRITLKKEWEDKYLKFSVTPVDKWEGIGEQVISEAAGPVDVNFIKDPGFEKDGEGWKGMALSNRDAYEGLVRGIVNANSEASQEITVEKDAYYDLSAFVRYSGDKTDGKMILEDEGGAVLAEVDVPAAEDYVQIEQQTIALEHGQKVTLRFEGASDTAFDVDNVRLSKDRTQGVPPFNSIVEITTEPKAFETVIDRGEKVINLAYLYGEDISKTKIASISVSEGAEASVKEGDVINLENPLKIEVKGKDGKTAVWTVKASHKEKKVAVESSNEYLEDTFNWAAHKMDQFVMTGKHGLVNKDENRPNGTGEADYEPSYWAGYYDRTAYYSRDFVHQATGAQIAGLEEENYNMFETFAENCTEARKWYTLWCFNFDGTPHTIDYTDDTWFVREVPAQFELVEKAYKQYLWSGDERYISDDMFEYYTNVMTKFVEEHDTNGNGVAEGTGGGIFEGTASYNERGDEPLLEAGDSIGSQYQATLAYAGILKARGDENGAAEWNKKAEDLKKYFNEEWSVADGDTSTYARGLSTDKETKYMGFGKENSWFMPMKMITEPGERNDAYIDFIIQNLGDGIGSSGAPTNLEAYTYIPDMLFPYNRNDEAWKWMKYITSIKDEPHERPSQGTNGDYPEISFTFVSQVIEGMMGVEPNAGENFVATSPRLPSDVADVTAKYVDIGDYELDLTHTGNTKSELKNHNVDNDIVWEARFYGDYDYISFDGKTVPAQTKEINGETVSYAEVTVPADSAVSAEAVSKADPGTPEDPDDPEDPDTPADPEKPGTDDGNNGSDDSDLPGVNNNDDAHNDQNNQGSKANSPKTGDPTNVAGAAAAVLAAAGTGAFSMRLRRKHRKSR